jgi:integrase/recombinase XerC
MPPLKRHYLLMVTSFIKYLAYEKRCSPHTLTSYKLDLEQFQIFLKSEFEISEPEQAQHAHIRSWVISLVAEEILPKSINRKIATLRSYFKFLLRREVIIKDPMVKVKSLKTEKRLPDFVQEKEILNLLDNFDFPNDWGGWRDKLILELFYATGMREAELINLKEEDISHHDGSLKVLGKRNKERIIPVSTALLNTIKAYLNKKKEAFGGNSSPYLIVKNNGSQAYPMLIYRTVNHYLKLFSTVEQKSPHILRHTFATHLLDKGAELNAVKDLLGHTSLAATQVYTHNSLDKLKKVFDQAHPKA